MNSKAKEINYTDEYKEKVLDWKLWAEKAEELIEAANCIKPKIEGYWKRKDGSKIIPEHLITIYFMLCSYALENLLKALYIKNNKVEIKNELETRVELPKCIKKHNHNLVYFAKELNVMNLECGEEALLKRLSRSATWFGRYPIPTKPQDLDRFYDSEFENEKIPYRQYTNTDTEELEKIVDRIKNKLKQ